MASKGYIVESTTPSRWKGPPGYGDPGDYAYVYPGGYPYYGAYPYFHRHRTILFRTALP